MEMEITYKDEIESKISTNTDSRSNPTSNSTSNPTSNPTSEQNRTPTPSAPPSSPNQQINLVDAIRHFIQTENPYLLIGTPCFGGLLHSGYVKGLTELCIRFTQLNIPFEIIHIGNESLVHRARNGIVAKFMSEPKMTHLMFIDADITFNWLSIIRLLLFNKPLSGGCYPKKNLNWDKLKKVILERPNISYTETLARSLDYVFNPEYEKINNQFGRQELALNQETNAIASENISSMRQVRTFSLEEKINNQLVIRSEGNFVKVQEIGTGFMMIKKEVFNTLIWKFPELKYRNNVAGYHNNKLSECFYTFFNTVIDPETKIFLSEDYYFCKLWKQCGGNIWVDLETNLNHTGSMEYTGCISYTIDQIDDLNQDIQQADALSYQNTTQ